MRSQAAHWPAVGTNPLLVECVSIPTADEILRVLVPGLTRDGSPVPWAEVAEKVGVNLSATTAWSDLVPRHADDGPYSMRWGNVSIELVRGLRGALATLTPEGPLDLVGWRGYAAAHDWHEWGAVPVEPPDDRTPWHDGQHLQWLRRTWEDLEALAHAQRMDFPSAVLPHSGAFLIARPRYSDSLYISGPAGLRSALTARGLEAFPIAASDHMPVNQT